MRLPVFILLALALSACGQPLAAPEPAPPGIYATAGYADHLAARFYEVKDCTGFPYGEFADLLVAVEWETFPCRWYEAGCAGEYTSPNLIRVGDPEKFGHEVVHYLLDLNTGDPDPEHDSDLFWRCG